MFSVLFPFCVNTLLLLEALQSECRLKSARLLLLPWMIIAPPLTQCQVSHIMVVPCQHRADTETGQFPMRFNSAVDSRGLPISNAPVITFWFMKDWGSPVVYIETRVLEIAEVPELIYRYLVVHYRWWFISAFHRSCKSIFWCSLSREWECFS